MTWKTQKQNVEYGGRYTRAKTSGVTEKVTKCVFEVHVKKPSILAKGKNADDPENSYMTCPHCASKGPILGHGDTAECDCGLNMQAFGNGLTIWMPPRIVK